MKVEKEKEILDKLGNIENLLFLIARTLASESPADELKLGSTQTAVLQLCNLENTREDMARKLRKTTNSIDVAINSLRKKITIHSVTISGSTYYLAVKN